MMQYLVILLDDTSVAYCHCDNPHRERRLIGLDDLRAGILYAMKHNLMLQFVYPDYELPQDYLDAIDTIDHHDIVPFPMQGDVAVLNTVADAAEGAVCVLRTSLKELFAAEAAVADALRRVQRLNVVITDLDTFTDDHLAAYAALLDRWAALLKEEYLAGRTPQLNLLTDRMMLSAPNHCNAGVENITLAPNGRFYLCPAFYYTNPEDSVAPADIPNAQLLRLDHAPLCRRCDAFHCRRCLWLNQRTTLEVNTPGRQQCIVAHTERNASRRLLAAIRSKASFMPEVDINQIDYIDPFDVKNEF